MGRVSLVAARDDLLLVLLHTRPRKVDGVGPQLNRLRVLVSDGMTAAEPKRDTTLMSSERPIEFDGIELAVARRRESCVQRNSGGHKGRSTLFEHGSRFVKTRCAPREPGSAIL